jgi:tripartite-type tricarboxylate transporter receptor subunit TctC
MKLAAPLAIALTCGSATAHAADAYPSRPIRMVVPFAPGGGSDIIARLVAPRMTDALGQTVVVDNRPGGNTVIGVRLVGTARPDGHTLLLVNANFTINAALYEKLPYDPIRDFVAVAPLSNVANVLVVHPGVPAKSVKELVALVKAKPGQLNFASPGAGTSSHMAGVLLQALAGLDYAMVLYKGAGPAMTDLVGGQVNMAVAAMSSVTSHVKAGKLRALGVTTAKRSSTMPEIPAIAESIPGYEVTNWFGVLAAAGTPAPVVAQLNSTIARVVNDGEFQKLMATQGNEPFAMSRADFERFIKTEVAKWAKLGRDYKLRVE